MVRVLTLGLRFVNGISWIYFFDTQNFDYEGANHLYKILFPKIFTRNITLAIFKEH